MDFVGWLLHGIRFTSLRDPITLTNHCHLRSKAWSGNSRGVMKGRGQQNWVKMETWTRAGPFTLLSSVSRPEDVCYWWANPRGCASITSLGSRSLKLPRLAPCTPRLPPPRLPLQGRTPLSLPRPRPASSSATQRTRLRLSAGRCLWIKARVKFQFRRVCVCWDQFGLFAETCSDVVWGYACEKCCLLDWIISAYNGDERLEEALDTFRSMLDMRLRPNSFTSVKILTACS